MRGAARKGDPPRSELAAGSYRPGWRIAATSSANWSATPRSVSSRLRIANTWADALSRGWLLIARMHCLYASPRARDASGGGPVNVTLMCRNVSRWSAAGHRLIACRAEGCEWTVYEPPHEPESGDGISAAISIP